MYSHDSPQQMDNSQDESQNSPQAVPTSTDQSDLDAKTNLIVNYIPPSVSEAGLRDLFTAYGHIESCRLMIDKATGHSLGYGFVKFVTPESATDAINGLNGKQIETKMLKVSYARPSSPQIQHTNLYVSQLDPNFTKQDLERLFSPYGKIIDSRILVGQNRSVAFVRYDTRNEAEAAVANLNGCLLQGATMPL